VAPVDGTLFWIIIAAVFALIFARQPRNGCKSCGFKNRGIAKYCGKCGNKIKR
jgi:hypothetical protein